MLLVIFKKPICDDSSFEDRHIILLKGAISRWVHCDHKGMGQQALRDQKCTKKISPTLLYQHYQPELLIQDSTDSCFYNVYAKF